MFGWVENETNKLATVFCLRTPLSQTHFPVGRFKHHLSQSESPLAVPREPPTHMNACNLVSGF